MAKKNSSKTATEKSISASEPKVQVFTGWQGVNFKESPLGWEFDESRIDNTRQTDLKTSYLLIQNNLVTTDGLTVETRPDSEVIFFGYDYDLTGVACMWRSWLICAAVDPMSGRQLLIRHDINEDVNDKDTYHIIMCKDAERQTEPSELFPEGYEITEIGYYEETLIVLTRHPSDEERYDEYNYRPWEAEMYTGALRWRRSASGTGFAVFGNVVSRKKLPDPVEAPALSGVNIITNSTIDDVDDTPMTTRVEVEYVWCNDFGSTLPSEKAVIYCDSSPVTWSGSKYLNIKGPVPDTDAFLPGIDITGVDIYLTLDENQEAVFAGHVNITENTWDEEDVKRWSFDWLGALSDVSQWTNVALQVPEENSTKGVPASYFANHDSRLYFWGDPENPYRLYIGGNPGSELSIARGTGGAWVDIEPGSGIEVRGTAKWKTTSGANIVTIMCGNPNTNKVKRFNLVETNTTVTNELSVNGYMYEEVSNVVGCNSRWGFGVFADGLYSVSRYGLMLTTMAMEYNAQMRNQSVSEVIQPIFTERIGHRLNDARIVAIDDVIYVVLSEEPEHPDDPQSLDRVILCYDMDLKAWYTFTHDGNDGLLLHAMAIDSDEHHEGLGIVSQREVTLYPTTGIQDPTQPSFDILLETGELSARVPTTAIHYLSQLELRFDYFVGSGNVTVEGVDYYGRPFRVIKFLNRMGIRKDTRDWVEWIRVDRLVENYHITIKGPARFRLTHIVAKAFTQSNRVGIVYGYDDHDTYRKRNGTWQDMHHYIKDYNNLRRAIVP